ncbi:MAG: SLBB domain-containing protein [bacterium]
MKPFKSCSSVVFLVLISYFTQTFCMPFALAQRGIFVREGEEKKDDSEKSFRTKSSEDENGSGTAGGTGGLPGIGSRGGLEGAMQQRREGLEGTAGGLGTSSSGLGAAGLIYQVNIVGEVKRPGTYRIPPSTRLSEALQMAGGIRNNGSERNIELRQPGGGPGKKMDLTAFKLFGRLEDNPYLVDNQVIFVPIKQRVVEIEGAVNRPGIYELKGERTLADLVRLGGGVTQGVSRKDPIRVIRYGSDEKKNIIEIQNAPEELRKTEILNGDVAVVPHMFTTQNTFDYNLKKLPNDNLFYPSYEDRVFVIGAVEVPGAYNFNQYYKLSNYLALAGGMTRMAKGYVKVVEPSGQERKLKPDDRGFLINPGDTLYIPEKALSRETWISLITTLASLGLSAATSVVVLSR